MSTSPTPRGGEPVAVHPLNSHARFAAWTCARLGYGFRVLDEDGYLFEVVDGARRCVIGSGAASPYALNTAAAAALARDKAFAAHAFAAAGVAAIPTRLFFTTPERAAFRRPGREPVDARAAARGFAFPVFCKPASGSRGDFAAVIADAGAFDAYLEAVAARYEAVLVQPVVSGAEHRVIVLAGRALCAYAKAPPVVVGDGRSALAALVAQARATAAPSTSRLAPTAALIGVGENGAAVAADAVPAAGAVVRLIGPANRSAGGAAYQPESPAPPALAAFGERTAAALGLDFAGVDVFDVSPARDLSELVVIEANASPALQSLEEAGRMDLIQAIWAANLDAALR